MARGVARHGLGWLGLGGGGCGCATVGCMVGLILEKGPRAGWMGQLPLLNTVCVSACVVPHIVFLLRCVMCLPDLPSAFLFSCPHCCSPPLCAAHPQEFVRLARAMAAGETTDPGPPPPNQLAAQWSLVPPVVADGAPAGKQFGDVVQDVGQGGPFAPGDTVTAVFVAGCPRNNIRQEGTFLTGGWQGGV